MILNNKILLLQQLSVELVLAAHHVSTGSFLLKDQKLSAIKDSKYHFLMLFLDLEDRSQVIQLERHLSSSDKLPTIIRFRGERLDICLQLHLVEAS